MKKRILFLVSLILLLTVPPGTAAGTPGRKEVMEIAHTLENRSLDTLKAMLETLPPEGTPEEEFLFHIMSFSGASGRFYQFLSWRYDVEPEQKLLLRFLNKEASSVALALYRAKVAEDIRLDWSDCQTALSLLNSYYHAEKPATASHEESGTQQIPPEILRKDLIIEVRSSDFHGNIFTPYLQIDGFFKGKNIRNGSLRIEDTGGNILLEEESAFAEIDNHYKNHSRTLPASIPFSRRIDNNQLASGNNIITITLYNGDGEYNREKLEIKKKKLHF